MPRERLFDSRRFDPAKILIGRAELREMNPQRFEMEQLDGILHIDKEAGTVVGLRSVRADEWWARGHVPGKPILPGVLILEAAAQLGNFFLNYPNDRALWGLAGFDDVRFRGLVSPGDRIIICGKVLDRRRRLCRFALEGYVEDRLVVEGTILGTVLFDSFLNFTS